MVSSSLTYNAGQFNSLGPGFEEEEPDTGGGFWNWWNRNGDSATDVFNTGMCAINPRRAGCQGDPRNYPTGGYASNANDQTILYVIVGIVVLMLFILILRK